jgi:hypothetical protein
MQARRELEDVFPRLANTRWKLKSPFNRYYKCIAWAACRTDHIWWPHEEDPIPEGVYWPPGIPRNRRVQTFVQAFERLGYRPCGKDSSSFEFGYQKVAIYAWDPDTTTHMARQQFFGKRWLSKPGAYEDILHDTLECIASDPPYRDADYGEVLEILKRSWWTALINLCIFRCVWHASKFAFYRGIWQLVEAKRRVLS